MTVYELLLLAIGLSMDAFAVSVGFGLSMQRVNLKDALLTGLYFGGFQAIMPVLGYLLGAQFADKIAAFDHWIAFALLAFIGGKMIKESFEQQEAAEKEIVLTCKIMLPLALATSIDALAVGISFAFLKVDLASSVACIGITTFLLSILGMIIGNRFGLRYKNKAEFIGGAILVLIGLKILLEHLGIL